MERGIYSYCTQSTWTVSGDKRFHWKLNCLCTGILVICYMHIIQRKYSLRAVIHYNEYYATLPHLHFSYFIYFLLEMISGRTQETV